MSMLLMVVLIGLALSALLVPMVISQNRTTRFDATRVQSLDAAQAGVDVSLGLIRSAMSVDANGNTYGDGTKLPCGPLTGTVNVPSIAAYSVKIEYFTFDPILQPDVSTRAMNCVAGYGVYDPVASLYTPSYARLTATGTVGAAVNGSSAGRTLISTYVFKTTNTNIAGGTIQLGSSGTALCMDAGSATAIAGTTVMLQTCSTSTPPLAQQSFAYRTDLTLQLLSSVTSANPSGLCLAPSATPPLVTNSIQLAQCGALGSPPYTQQWSYNDGGQYQASGVTSKTDGVLPDLCITASAAAGVPLVLSTCGSASAWIPSAQVGPGAAALPQWVNYSEFGRCLDVTSQQIAATHLIDYPCKQNPNPNSVTWNQKFYAPAIPTGSVSVTGASIYATGVPAAPTAKYCLTSPGTNGGYVTMGSVISTGVQPCGATSAATAGNSVSLGSAASFSVLAGAAATVPTSTLPGEVGAVGAIADNAGTVYGSTRHTSNDAATQAALADATTTYNDLSTRAATGTLASSDLAGQTITPGVYHSSGAYAMTTPVTFDAQNDPNAYFIMQGDAALNTTASTTMNLINGAQASHIFWVLKAAVTLGASSTFYGTIMSKAAITVGASVHVYGRALSISAAVSLNADIFGPVSANPTVVTGTPTLAQTWTIYGGDSSLSYAQKYTIVDSNGLCLGLNAPVGSEQWSSIDVETCTGTAEQKWNASPNVLNPALQNTREK